MTPELQTIAALAAVMITVTIFARRWWLRRNEKGCGGSCGCTPKIAAKSGRKIR